MMPYMTASCDLSEIRASILSQSMGSLAISIRDYIDLDRAIPELCERYVPLRSSLQISLQSWGGSKARLQLQMQSPTAHERLCPCSVAATARPS